MDDDEWSDAAISATLARHFGVGSQAGLPNEIRFLASASALIKTRLSGDYLGEEAGGIAVFILHPGLPDKVAGSARSHKRFPMLDNGIERICRRIWFVNQIVNDGWAVDLLDDEDDASLFSLVVESLEVGGAPAVVLDTRPATPVARYYPDGLSCTDTCQTVRLNVTDLSLEDISAVVERLHEQNLCTPDVQNKAGKLWADARRAWASDSAEDEVSIVVLASLIGAFPTCRVRAEQTQATGRLDIEIEEPDPSQRSKVTRHAVIELKVLRGLRSSGASVGDPEINDWIEKGVMQASEYRTERGSRLAALFCFDMRKQYIGDACFDHVRALAKQLDVGLRCWHLFSSSAAYRKHRVSMQLATQATDL